MLAEQACPDGSALAALIGANQADGHRLLRPVEHNVGGAVRARVVDDQDLGCHGQLSDFVTQSAKSVRKPGLLIPRRDNDL